MNLRKMLSVWPRIAALNIVLSSATTMLQPAFAHAEATLTLNGDHLQ
jgi:hypothetical protein